MALLKVQRKSGIEGIHKRFSVKFKKSRMDDVLKQFLTSFQSFSEAEISTIIANTQVESFKKGTVVLEEGKVSNKCFLVIKGLVIKGCLRQYRMVDGEEKTTGFFTEGQPAILYSSYLNRLPSEYSLSCVEDSILTTGTREQEQNFSNESPKLEHLVQILMPQDYARREDHVALLNFHKPEERYKLLMKTQPSLLNRVPLHQIASYIGVTPESFSRIRKRVMKSENQQKQSD